MAGTAAMRDAGGQKREGGRHGGRRERRGTAAAPIGDPRFARLHTDPRFQRLPKNKVKLAVDSRFAHMFSDKEFRETSVDKRGFGTKSEDAVNPLRRYYKLDENEDKVAGIDRELRGGKGKAEKKTKKKKKKKKKKEENDGGDGLSDPRKRDAHAAEISEEELGFGARGVDLGVAKTRRGKEDGRKGRAKEVEAIVTEEIVDSGDSDAGSEEFDDESGGQVRRIRARKDSESDEEDDDGGADEREEERDGDDDALSTSSSSSSSESESEVEDHWDDGGDDEKVPTTSNETRRLAMMNMDWEHIQAVHLLVLMRSFAPKGGLVSSVAIYPSEFGIEQMKEENVQGPKSIFRAKDEEDEDEEDGPDMEKLRDYEKARLRYFYAVVECDSPSTAAHLYNNCDGLEFESTSNTLDLRYIPDEMEFKRAPRDTATEVPAGFKPIEFETRALQHSTVKLTWDDDEPVRKKALRRKFNPDELNEMDFRDYVASSSDSDSERGEDLIAPDADEGEDHEVNVDRKEKDRSKYLSLLAGSEETNVLRGKKAERGNIEIKFNTGLEELSEKLLAKAQKDKSDETVWEAYLRRKKEKKHEKRNQKASTDSDVSSGDQDVRPDGLEDDAFFDKGGEDPFDDPFFSQDGQENGSSRISEGAKQKEAKTEKGPIGRGKTERERRIRKEDAAREKKEAENRRADLELLLMDDHMVQNGELALNDASVDDKPAKKRKSKKKMGAKGKSEELQQKISSSVNYDDPRFAALFTSHHFALDPTHPQYKKTGSRITDKQRQQFQSSKMLQEQTDNSANREDALGGDRKRKAELSSLVRSLKSKMQSKAIGNHD